MSAAQAAAITAPASPAATLAVVIATAAAAVLGMGATLNTVPALTGPLRTKRIGFSRGWLGGWNYHDRSRGE